MHLATNSGSFIRTAPNLPFWTLSLGHPIFKLISENPNSSDISEASESKIGSLPPICIASGCSLGEYFSKLFLSPLTIALQCNISV